MGCTSSRGASSALSGRKREGGSYIPSMSGVFGFGSAAFSCSDSRPEPPAPPGSRSNSHSGLPDSCPARPRPVLPLPRLPAAPLAGFSLDPLLVVSVAVDSVAPLRRVRGACHVIVAPLVARVAAEHGLADWWGGPGAWRASRRRRPASGAGTGRSSGRAPRAGCCISLKCSLQKLQCNISPQICAESPLKTLCSTIVAHYHVRHMVSV